MSARYSFPFSLLPSGRKAGFMALLLLVSLLAHWFIIDWARDSLALVSLLDDDDDVGISMADGDVRPAAQEHGRPFPTDERDVDRGCRPHVDPPGTSGARSGFCFMGSSICTAGRINCIRSLSEETIVTCPPIASKALA